MAHVRRAALAALALTLSACNVNSGKAWYQDGNAIAAAQSAGYTDVVVWKPSFFCQPAALGQPIVPVANAGGYTYGQSGHFLSATAPDGRHVRVMLCEGQHMPARVQELTGAQAGFTPAVLTHG